MLLKVRLILHMAIGIIIIMEPRWKDITLRIQSMSNRRRIIIDLIRINRLRLLEVVIAYGIPMVYMTSAGIGWHEDISHRVTAEPLNIRETSPMVHLFQIH